MIVKKMRGLLVLVLGLFFLSQDIVYGAVTLNTQNAEGTLRGELISSMELSLIDNGRGSLNIYADVLCHQNMKEIHLNLYLDQWNESTGAWSQIKSYKYVWDESNTPEEYRHSGVVDFDQSGLTRGKSYRLRGVAGATALDGTRSRIWKAETDAVQAQSIE